MKKKITKSLRVPDRFPKRTKHANAKAAPIRLFGPPLVFEQDYHDGKTILRLLAASLANA